MKNLEKSYFKLKSCQPRISMILNLSKSFGYFLLLFLNGQTSVSEVDHVDWQSLESRWRKPLCIEESIYPLDKIRAKKLADSKEDEIKKKLSVSAIERVIYLGSAQNLETLEDLRSLMVLRAAEYSRSSAKLSSYKGQLTRYSKLAYDFCSRLINKHPSTRCHDFLLVTIKPIEFMELVGRHFKEYQNSAIYALDMQNHCRSLTQPDSNCGELARDYFVKNHLESCLAGHLEPPEKIIMPVETSAGVIPSPQETVPGLENEIQDDSNKSN